jgi:hypothetical protein
MENEMDWRTRLHSGSRFELCRRRHDLTSSTALIPEMDAMPISHMARDGSHCEVPWEPCLHPVKLQCSLLVGRYTSFGDAPMHVWLNIKSRYMFEIQSILR